MYDRQSGFREAHSCQTALIKILDDWISAIDNNEIVGTLLIDLSKAFDLGNHDIMLQKLSLYGLQFSALNWFESYLEYRTQKTFISGKYSCPGKVSVVWFPILLITKQNQFSKKAMLINGQRVFEFHPLLNLCLKMSSVAIDHLFKMSFFLILM